MILKEKKYQAKTNSYTIPFNHLHVLFWRNKSLHLICFLFTVIYLILHHISKPQKDDKNMKTHEIKMPMIMNATRDEASEN